MEIGGNSSTHFGTIFSPSKLSLFAADFSRCELAPCKYLRFHVARHSSFFLSSVSSFIFMVVEINWKRKWNLQNEMKTYFRWNIIIFLSLWDWFSLENAFQFFVVMESASEGFSRWTWTLCCIWNCFGRFAWLICISLQSHPSVVFKKKREMRNQYPIEPRECRKSETFDNMVNKWWIKMTNTQFNGTVSSWIIIIGFAEKSIQKKTFSSKQTQTEFVIFISVTMSTSNRLKIVSEMSKNVRRMGRQAELLAQLFQSSL